MAVHDVDVENSGSALDGGLRIFAEPCEVSRENGGSEFDHGNVDSAASGSAGQLGFRRLHVCHFFDQATGILSPRRRPTGEDRLCLTTGNQEMP
jgi:hypothetical protein